MYAGSRGNVLQQLWGKCAASVRRKQNVSAEYFMPVPLQHTRGLFIHLFTMCIWVTK